MSDALQGLIENAARLIRANRHHAFNDRSRFVDVTPFFRGQHDSGRASYRDSQAGRALASGQLRARKINGQALTTAISSTLELAIRIFEINGEGVFPASREGQQEIGAVEIGNLSGAFLRDTTLSVPLNGGRETQLPPQFIRARLKDSVDSFRVFQAEVSHR